MMTTTQVRAHTRRKPSKPAIYIETHRLLRLDVEAMKRGELRESSGWKLPRVFSAVADALRSWRA